MYTSGTSGDPKGVVLTHETIATFVYGMDLFMEQFEDKVNAMPRYPKKFCVSWFTCFLFGLHYSSCMSRASDVLFFWGLDIDDSG